MCPLLGFLDRARKDLQSSRYFLWLFISLWKVLILFCLMILMESIRHGNEVALMMFRNFTDGFQSDQIVLNLTRPKPDFDPFIVDVPEHHLTADIPLIPLFVLLIHIGITYLCYSFGKYACKICIQSRCPFQLGKCTRARH